MPRKFAWSMIQNALVFWPLCAIFYMLLGYDPPEVRRMLAIIMALWFAWDVIRFAAWPHLRRLRLRWPIYRKLEPMFINVPALNDAELADFRESWAEQAKWGRPVIWLNQDLGLGDGYVSSRHGSSLLRA